jgi:hypothetical protein
MSENKFPVPQGGLPLGSAITTSNIDAAYGTHFSYLGVGGYVEVPNLDFRNAIPISSTIDADGYSSGRRRLGMMVYVMDEDQIYQLRPKKSDGSIVTIEEFNNASDAQKLVWLDPTASAFDFSTFTSINGTGVAADAWKPLSHSSDTKVTGATLTGSVLTIRQDNDAANINVDLSGLDDRFVYGGSYNSGVLTLNVSGTDDIDIPLQGLVNTIADTASFDSTTNQIVFSSQGGGNLFSVDLSSLKDNEDNLVADTPQEGEVDVVTEEELTDRIQNDFNNYLNNNLDSLI